MLVILFILVAAPFGGPSTTDAESTSPIIAWSPENVTALTEALVEERGDSIVFEVIFYSDHAYVEVPVNSSTRRVRILRWDGRELVDSNASTATSPRFDLGDIDPALPEQVLHEAEALIEGPTESQVFVSVSKNSEGPAEWFYVSSENEYGEGATVRADREGNVLSTSVD